VKGEDGFSLVEVLMATVLTMSLTGAVLSLVSPSMTASPALAEAIDLTERARVAGDQLFQDLSQAGAGLSAGPRVGALIDAFAPVVPRRMGLTGADAYTIARTDAVTIRYVPDTRSQTAVATFTLAPTARLILTSAPGCPAGPLCGLGQGTDVFIFDDQGHADTFTITQVQGGVASLQPHDASPYQYQPGAVVSEAVSRTFYFDAAQRQLRMYDGDQTDVPVVDHVVGLTFSYFGDPNPPRAPEPPRGTPNCLFDAAGQPDPAIAVLPSQSSALVPLPTTMFSDGPWCGSGAARFDADLLRVRRIRVTLRVEATQAMFRAAGPAFAHPGTAASALSAIPDVGMVFDVSPRAMNLKR
jgi:hypothetical protein